MKGGVLAGEVRCLRTLRAYVLLLWLGGGLGDCGVCIRNLLAFRFQRTNQRQKIYQGIQKLRRRNYQAGVCF